MVKVCKSPICNSKNQRFLHVLAKIRVQNYDKWKTLFDKFADERKSKGSQGASIFRDADDPNLVIVLFDWDSPDNARKHGKLKVSLLKEIYDFQNSKILRILHAPKIETDKNRRFLWRQNQRF